MKIRSFNLFDGLFLMALYFKLTNTNPVPTWFEVFLPYLMEAMFYILYIVFTMYSNIGERFLLMIAKISIKRKVRRNAEAVKKHLEVINKGGTNPGKHINPENLGK